MSLTYDQKSEIRIAFDEAYFEEKERRRAARVKHRIPAQVAPYQKRRIGEPVNVMIEDFSPTGVGLVHAEPFKIGAQYVLNVPRTAMEPLTVLLTVARCFKNDDGKFTVGMEITSVIAKSERGAYFDAVTESPEALRAIASRRTKVLFILFGIIGITAAVLMP